MSALWMITSPSIGSTGPGGCVLAGITARNRASPSAGVPAVSLARFCAFIAWKRKPEAAKAAMNLAGVILAVAVRWPSTSRTVQSGHREGVAHCSSLRPARSSASAVRSAWISGHGLSAAMALTSANVILSSSCNGRQAQHQNESAA
jgi:hypothetical protein